MPMDNSTIWGTWSDGDKTYPLNPLIASRIGLDGRSTLAAPSTTTGSNTTALPTTPTSQMGGHHMLGAMRLATT